MKTNIKNALLFIMLITIFSCSKSKIANGIIGDDDPIADSYYFKVTVDGTDYYKAGEEINRTFAVTTDGEEVRWAFIGHDFIEGATATSISGKIKGFDGIGTYNMADFDGSKLVYILVNLNTNFSESWIANSSNGSGVINVTQYGNNTATGTFSFTGINPIDNTEVSITNGEFHLQLVVQ
jgi:hypothetical protein